MPNHTESEFKLRAQQTIEIATIDAVLQELGATCRWSETRRHTDTYLDDAHGSLLRAGVGLRVRDSHDHKRLTCKARRTSTGSLFVRDEIEVDWPQDTLPKSVHDLPTEIQALVQPLVHNRTLKPQQSLSVLREIRILTDGNVDLCELAIDFVVAQANGHSAMFQEVELEVFHNVEANEQLARQLRERLPLEFASQDKPSYAASLLGMDPAPRSCLEDRALAPLTESVPMQLGEILQASQQMLPAAGQRMHATQLHTLLENYRSMRHVVQSFEDLWLAETANRLREHALATEQLIATVLDLHNMAEQLSEQLAALPLRLQECGDDLTHWLNDMQREANDRLHAWFEGSDNQAANQQFEQDLATVDANSAAAQQPLLHEAPRRLAQTVQQLRAQLDATKPELPAEEIAALLQAVQLVHDFATQCAGLPSMSYKKSLKAVARLQRHLEDAQRHQLAAECLVNWAVTPQYLNQHQALRSATLGCLALIQTVAATAARGVARNALERLDRDRVWRRFPIESSNMPT